MIPLLLIPKSRNASLSRMIPLLLISKSSKLHVLQIISIKIHNGTHLWKIYFFVLFATRDAAAQVWQGRRGSRACCRTLCAERPPSSYDVRGLYRSCGVSVSERRRVCDPSVGGRRHFRVVNINTHFGNTPARHIVNATRLSRVMVSKISCLVGSLLHPRFVFSHTSTRMSFRLWGVMRLTSSLYV